MRNEYAFGPWNIDYHIDDGGRLGRISYRGYDLLTTEPAHFSPPATDHGQYERRPVFGYDDCFPSVGACYYPGTRLYIPDHGELCWLKWDVQPGPNSLAFSVHSDILPLTFRRRMEFTDTAITWVFEVVNEGKSVHPFQHSMHPLLNVDEMALIKVPAFQSAYDWRRRQRMKEMNPDKVCELLLACPKGSTEMLFLRGVEEGKISWAYVNNIRVQMTFPVVYFPTIGIWWNNTGYPDEQGIRRCECAFEPTAGFTSILSEAHANGNCLSVEGGKSFHWQIRWEIDSREAIRPK